MRTSLARAVRPAGECEPTVDRVLPTSRRSTARSTTWCRTGCATRRGRHDRAGARCTADAYAAGSWRRDVQPEAPPDRLLPIRAVVSAGSARRRRRPHRVRRVALGRARTAFLRAGVATERRAAGPRTGARRRGVPAGRASAAAPRRSPSASSCGRRLRRRTALDRGDGRARRLHHRRRAGRGRGETARCARCATRAGTSVLSGPISPWRRTEAWNEARRGACVVVGGRIAVLRAGARPPRRRRARRRRRGARGGAGPGVARPRPRGGAGAAVRRAGSIVTPAPTVEAIRAGRASDRRRAATRSATRAGPASRWSTGATRRRARPAVVSARTSAAPRARRTGGRAVCVLNRGVGRTCSCVAPAASSLACEAATLASPRTRGLLRANGAARRAAVRCRVCGAGRLPEAPARASPASVTSSPGCAARTGDRGRCRERARCPRSTSPSAPRRSSTVSPTCPGAARRVPRPRPGAARPAVPSRRAGAVAPRAGSRACSACRRGTRAPRADPAPRSRGASAR